MILVTSKTSQAQCSCKNYIRELTIPAYHPFSEDFKKSATVFIGRVTKIKRQKYSQTTEFKVSRSWKPKTPNKVKIKTTGSCYFSFMKGKEYLVFASLEQNYLTVDLCSRTSETSEAEYDLDELARKVGKPKIH